MLRFGAFGFSAVFWVSCCSLRTSTDSADGSGAFATGHYRNLFAENGHSQREIREKIDGAFQQLFHGDPATQAVYFSSGANSNGPLAYITDIKHHDARTEGLSYGMMIAAQMNKKAEFDALWNWSKTYLYHDSPAHPSCGFFSWQAKTNGATLSEFVAPDGESYYAMALYFAANRWGNGSGIYNYKEQADQLLTNMRHRAMIRGPIFSCGALQIRPPPSRPARFSASSIKWFCSRPVPSVRRSRIPRIICPPSTNCGRAGAPLPTAIFGGTPPRPAAIFFARGRIQPPALRRTTPTSTERQSPTASIGAR